MTLLGALSIFSKNRLTDSRHASPGKYLTNRCIGRQMQPPMQGKRLHYSYIHVTRSQNTDLVLADPELSVSLLHISFSSSRHPYHLMHCRWLKSEVLLQGPIPSCVWVF